MIQTTIQYIEFVVAVYFYYDKDLMLLFVGPFLQKSNLYVGEDPAQSNGYAYKAFVQTLVISNSQLQLSRYYLAFVAV